MTDDLSALPWKPGPDNDGSVFAEVSAPPVPLYAPVGRMESPELAEEACASHNAALVAKKLARRGVRAHGMTGVQIGDGGTQFNQF